MWRGAGEPGSRENQSQQYEKPVSGSRNRRRCSRRTLQRGARLELQLRQQNLRLLQSQFGEGKVEFARRGEGAWTKMKNGVLLDANFQRQQAQLELLKTAGQLDKVLE